MAPIPLTLASALDAGDRAALSALQAAAQADAGASAAWWEAPDGSLLVGGPIADATRPAERHDAVIDARCHARLALAAPTRPPSELLQTLLRAAAALLRARGQAAESMLEAERLLEAGRAASDWLWETDADGNVMWMTESITYVTGRTAQQEVGTRTLTHNRVRTDEYAESWERYLADRAARRPIRDLVLDRDTLQGTITVSINGQPRFAPDGTFLGYRGATRNITPELVARAEARRAQQLLQQALDGVPAGIMISGPDDRILMANKEWHVGRDLPEPCETWTDVLRHHLRHGHFPDAIGREEEYLAWRRSLVSESPAATELRFRDSWRLIADRRLPDGSVVHLSFDITERKRVEQAHARAEDRWRFALDGAGHGVWEWDAEAGYYASPSWKAMLGIPEDGPPASWRVWRERLHPDDVAGVLAELDRHRQGLSEVYETEYRLRHEAGNYLWIHDRGRAIRRDKDGRPLRMVGTHSDVTRLRLADEALRDRQAAELATGRTNEFLSRMSHEMRTPLNAVIGFAELLHQRGEYRADLVEHIMDAGTHLLDLINDVLDLQQVEQGRLSLRPVGIDVAALVPQVVAMLRPQSRKLDVTEEIGELAGVVVRADEQRLRQALLNLASNAVKYNRPGGRVSWRALRDPAGRWGIVTEDTGPGLDASQLARLFRPFERLGLETSGTEGSGLGLVIARRLVEAMGGELVMESRPGAGTRVTVWLPAEEQAWGPQPGTLARAPAGAEDDTADPSPRQVIYVEDNPLNALLFSEALRDHPDLRLQVAGDGDEALALVRDCRPDLLVIDMHLPGANGSEVLRRLRQLPGLDAVPAVVCSADAMPQDQSRALANGFSGYWTKPLDVRLIAGRIRAAIRAAERAAERAG